MIIQLADRSNAYPKGVLEDVLVQVGELIFPADFYVLDMEDSPYSTPLPILLGRPFMKTAQTKIDVAKGELTMEFGGDLIKFKVPEYAKNSNDVRSCFAIDVIKNSGQEHSSVPRSLIEEGFGVKHKKLAEKTTFAAHFESSLKGIGKPPPLIPIPISTNRLLPSVVQVPIGVHDGGIAYFDFGKPNATIWEHHYPLPYIDPMHETVEEHVVEDVPLHAVGPNQA